MKNSIFIKGLILGILITLIAGVAYIINSKFSSTTLQVGIGIINISALLLLLKYGTLIKTKFFKFSLIALAIVGIGALFKIMHWPFSQELFILGALGLVVIYALSFFKKPAKKRLDYLKLAFAIIIVYSTLSIIFKWLPYNFTILAYAMLWLCTLDFLIQENHYGNKLRS